MKDILLPWEECVTRRSRHPGSPHGLVQPLAIQPCGARNQSSLTHLGCQRRKERAEGTFPAGPARSPRLGEFTRVLGDHRC